MRTCLFVWSLVCVQGFVVAANAQAVSPAADGVRETPPAVSPPPAAGATDAVVCVLGDHTGFEEADAHTVATLVCDALRSAGARVAREPVRDRAGRAAYEVSLLPLGQNIILRVSFRSASGATGRSSQLQLHQLEEVTVAAGRLAEAILHSTKIADTAEIDSLVGEESRAYEKRTGETLVALGVLGFAIPSGAGTLGYGAFGRLSFEAPRYAVGIEARIAGTSANSSGWLGGFGVNGRLFMQESDVSLFVGAGVALLWLGAEADHGRRVRGSGFAPQIDLGVELLRAYRSRFDVFVRLDLPIFGLQTGGGQADLYAPSISLMTSYSLGGHSR